MSNTARFIGIVGVVAMSLAGCGGPAGEQPARREAASSPTPASGSPLDRHALGRLGQLGRAGLDELGYDDSKVRVTVEGDEILVVIRAKAVRLTPPPSPATTGEGGLAAAPVRDEAFGVVWRFGCELPGFGERVV